MHNLLLNLIDKFDSRSLSEETFSLDLTKFISIIFILVQYIE